MAGLERRRAGVRYPVLVPNLRGLARAEAAGADALAVFTAASDAFTTRNIRMTVDESLAAFAPGPRPGRRARLVAPRLRLDRVRLPVFRGRRSRPGCRGRPPPARPRRRRDLLRRHDRGRGPAQVGELTARAVDAGHPPGPDRLPLPRHARHGARQRRRRPVSRGPGLRRLDRRHGRLPLRARAPRAISRPRTWSTCSTRIGMTHGVSLERRPRRGPLHRRRARPAARDEGRPGGRLGSGHRRTRAGPDPDRRIADADSRGSASRIVRSWYRAVHDERCRARAEPELRAVERLQPAAGVPTRVRREGRGHRVRPPGHPDAREPTTTPRR